MRGLEGDQGPHQKKEDLGVKGMGLDLTWDPPSAHDLGPGRSSPLESKGERELGAS